MEIIVAALLAAGIGALGPTVVRRLPEPVVHPDDEAPADAKIPYARLGRSPGTDLLLAVLAGALAGVAAGALPDRTLLAVWIVFCGVGSWLVWVDWRTRLLPFLITAPLHVLVLLLVVVTSAVVGDWSVLGRALVANVAVFAGFWLIWFIGARVGSTFGYGDVRLSGIIALALGPLGATVTLTGLYGGFLLGAIGGIVLSSLGVVDRKGFAFGPYMVVGAVAGLAVAPLI